MVSSILASATTLCNSVAECVSHKDEADGSNPSIATLKRSREVSVRFRFTVSPANVVANAMAGLNSWCNGQHALCFTRRDLRLV